jgi:hypothetical protein
MFVILATVATASAQPNPFAGFDWSTVAFQAFALLSTVLTVGLPWLGATIGKWVVAKTKSEVAGRATDFAFEIVQEINQTVAAKIREASADGVITDAEKAQIKDAALSVFKSRLGTKGIAEIKGVLGIEPSALDGFLGGLIESAVHKLKILAPFDTSDEG